MVKSLLKYIISFILIIALGLYLLENVVLPVYVGNNNEHYLPDVRGKFREAGQIELNKLGFQTEVIIKGYSNKYEPGTIINISPRPFTKVKEGRTIKMTIAGERRDVIMPDFLGTSIRNAILEIHRIDLEIDTLMEEFNTQFEEGIITYQMPKAERVIKSGTLVTLMVSKGDPPDFFRVPDLLNLSLRKAEVKILDAGLKLGDIVYEYHPELISDTVIDQSLTSGMRLTIPARIDLVISTDQKE